MSFERIRMIFLGLGGIVLVAGGLWIAVNPGPIGTRLVGAFGVLFFSAGVWATFRLAFKGQTPRSETARAWRTSKLILPLALIFTLPWDLKLWFALPLLAAWLALVPQYRDRRALMAAALFAGALSISQALLFSFGVYATIQEAQRAGAIALQVVFLVMVLSLDAALLWHVRSRLRERSSSLDAAPLQL
jgi:hypothetical protein